MENQFKIAIDNSISTLKHVIDETYSVSRKNGLKEALSVIEKNNSIAYYAYNKQQSDLSGKIYSGDVISKYSDEISSENRKKEQSEAIKSLAISGAESLKAFNKFCDNMKGKTLKEFGEAFHVYVTTGKTTQIDNPDMLGTVSDLGSEVTFITDEMMDTISSRNVGNYEKFYNGNWKTCNPMGRMTYVNRTAKLIHDKFFSKLGWQAKAKVWSAAMAEMEQDYKLRINDLSDINSKLCKNQISFRDSIKNLLQNLHDSEKRSNNLLLKIEGLEFSEKQQEIRMIALQRQCDTVVVDSERLQEKLHYLNKENFRLKEKLNAMPDYNRSQAKHDYRMQNDKLNNIIALLCAIAFIMVACIYHYITKF